MEAKAAAKLSHPSEWWKKNESEIQQYMMDSKKGRPIDC